jgi:hypothetical protein
MQLNTDASFSASNAVWGYTKPGDINIFFNGGVAEFKSKNYPNKSWGVSSSNKASIVDYMTSHRFRIVSPGLTGEAGSISF